MPDEFYYLPGNPIHDKEGPEENIPICIIHGLKMIKSSLWYECPIDECLEIEDLPEKPMYNDKED